MRIKYIISDKGILNRHRGGTGISGKTKFPSSWSDDKIINEVNIIANDLKAIGGMGKWDSPYKTGIVSVPVEVEQFKRGQIV